MLHGFPVLKLERVARHYLQARPGSGARVAGGGSWGCGGGFAQGGREPASRPRAPSRAPAASTDSGTTTAATGSSSSSSSSSSSATHPPPARTPPARAPQTWFVIDLLSSVPFSSLPITGPWAAFRLLKATPSPPDLRPISAPLRLLGCVCSPPRCRPQVMRLLRIRRLMQRWKAFAAAKVRRPSPWLRTCVAPPAVSRSLPPLDAAAGASCVPDRLGMAHHGPLARVRLVRCPLASSRAPPRAETRTRAASAECHPWRHHAAGTFWGGTCAARSTRPTRRARPGSPSTGTPLPHEQPPGFVEGAAMCRRSRLRPPVPEQAGLGHPLHCRLGARRHRRERAGRACTAHPLAALAVLVRPSAARGSHPPRWPSRALTLAHTAPARPNRAGRSRR